MNRLTAVFSGAFTDYLHWSTYRHGHLWVTSPPKSHCAFAKAKMQTVMQDLQLHLNYVTIYASTCGKRNWKYNLQFYLKIVRKKGLVKGCIIVQNADVHLLHCSIIKAPKPHSGRDDVHRQHDFTILFKRLFKSLKEPDGLVLQRVDITLILRGSLRISLIKTLGPCQTLRRV